jgi:type I restriction enzyme M protein
LKTGKRWVYDVPPAANASFAWVQHFIHHLAPTRLAGFVLAVLLEADPGPLVVSRA